VKLLKVGFDNFRGFSSAFDLFGLDVFAGENGVGKTRILQAVQLALSGTVPDRTKNIETIELFSQTEGVGNMGAAVGLDEISIARHFKIKTKDGKDSVEQEIATEPDWNLGVKDTERKIQELIGSFPVMLDINVFVDMSDLERQQFISTFCAVDNEKWSAKTLYALVTNDVSMTAVGGGEVNMRPFLRQIEINLPRPGTEGLQLLLNYLKRRESELSKEVKTNDATSQGALQSQTADGTKSFRNVEDIRLEYTTTQTERDKLVHTIAEAKATKEAVERLEKEKLQLRTKIGGERRFLEGKNSQYLRDRIQEEIDLFRPIPERSTENRQRLDEAKSETERINRELAVHQSELGELIRQIDLLKGGKCPVCGQVATVVVEALGEKVKEKEAVEQTYRTRISSLTEKVAELIMAIDKETAEIDMIERVNESAKEHVRKLENDLAVMEGKESAIKMMEDRLAELERTPVTGMSTNLAEAERMLAGVDTALDRLNKEAKEKQAYDTKIMMAKETAAKSALAKETLEQVKVLIKRVQSLRLEIVGESLKAIMTETNELLKIVIPDASFAFRLVDARGNEALQLGWKKDGVLGPQFINFASLSTGQKLITLSSLLPPLIDRGNPKLRVLLLDNIEVISSLYINGYLRLLETAKEKYLDNIICTTSGKEPMTIGAVAWHNLLKG
jgi:DNA repair exonuclease SbcCD ATPase subunit